jgi:hypothetical protein
LLAKSRSDCRGEEEERAGSGGQTAMGSTKARAGAGGRQRRRGSWGRRTTTMGLGDYTRNGRERLRSGSPDDMVTLEKAVRDIFVELLHFSSL